MTVAVDVQCGRKGSHTSFLPCMHALPHLQRKQPCHDPCCVTPRGLGNSSICLGHGLYVHPSWQMLCNAISTPKQGQALKLNAPVPCIRMCLTTVCLFVSCAEFQEFQYSITLPTSIIWNLHCVFWAKTAIDDCVAFCL